MPPFLAGRERERTFFRDLVTDLASGVPPETQVVLYGPRGNGKTVLLRWLEGETAARGEVDEVSLAPSGIGTAERLSELLLPLSWWSRLTPSEVALAGFTWRPGQDRPPPMEDILAVRARNRPLVVLVDEAHTLELPVGRALLNAAQYVGDRLPFLLVLAGTPNLRGHLNAMGASFWNRAERFPIGRLDAGAAAEALRRPLENEGVPVEDGALDFVVELSHGYPYFVQLLGRGVWRAMTADGGAAPALTPAVVYRALPEFERIRGDYYLDRYRELEARELFGAARAVAEAFETGSALSDSELGDAVAHGLGSSDQRRVRSARDELSDLGYVWGPGPDPRWEPGIPSLMDYVREHAPAN